jgi:hypothetical protein
LHLTNVLVSGVAMFAKKFTDIFTDKLSKFVEFGLLNVEGKNKGRKYRINKNTLQ